MLCLRPEQTPAKWTSIGAPRSQPRRGEEKRDLASRDFGSVSFDSDQLVVLLLPGTWVLWVCAPWCLPDDL